MKKLSKGGLRGIFVLLIILTIVMLPEYAFIISIMWGHHYAPSAYGNVLAVLAAASLVLSMYAALTIHYGKRSFKKLPKTTEQ